VSSRVVLSCLKSVSLQLHHGPGFDSASKRNEFRNLPGGGGAGACPVYKADNLTANCDPIVLKIWDSQLLTTI
jgi:hypothetical protein